MLSIRIAADSIKSFHAHPSELPAGPLSRIRETIVLDIFRRQLHRINVSRKYSMVVLLLRIQTRS
jgi:hypothetical protein